jgi:tetratricopeptide (TPR) repeat protein
MAFLPHARRWRALAVLVAWLLLLARSGAFQTATDHVELGLQIFLGWIREDGKNDKPANTRSNSEVADRAQNQTEKARREYQQSLNIYRSLAQKDPETFLPYVAATLNDLGILDSDQNRIEEARKEYEEALKIYEAFAKQNPEHFTTDVKRLKKLLQELPK